MGNGSGGIWWIVRSLSVALMFGGTVHAGRPLTVNDTEPVGKGQWQVEAAWAFEKESGLRHQDVPVTLATGLMRGVDLQMGYGHQFEEGVGEAGEWESVEGKADFTMTPRWKFLDQTCVFPSQAVSFTVKVPTSDENRGLGSGETDYDLTWILSRTFGEKTQFDANIGYAWLGNPDGEDIPDVVHYGLAGAYQLFPKVKAVGEVFAEKETVSGGESVSQYDAGFRLALLDSLTLDAAAGSRLGHEGPTFTLTAGCTWLFGGGK